MTGAAHGFRTGGALAGDRPLGAEPAGALVLIGASTGGVDALTEVLSGFPADCPPTLIVQHMPASYLPGFISRIDRIVPPAVGSAEEGERPVRGAVRFAGRPESHLVLSREMRLGYQTTPPINGHRPSVDALFLSATRYAARIVGVILTGIGRDGADGLHALRAAGARTFCQDEATSTVFGMPRAAGPAAERHLPIRRIAETILEAAAAIEARGARKEIF